MWKFYYDEAFHDRKITVKEDFINIYQKGSSDIYVGFFCGYREIKEKEIWEKYNIFEEKYKKIYTIDKDKELKGTTIKKKNYKNGFSSFVKNTVQFYNDFFEILDDSEVIFHVSMFSKTELIIKEFMKNVIFDNTISFDKDAFLYSLIKFLYNYRNQELLKKMIQVQDTKDVTEALNYIKNMLNKVILESEASKKKVVERNALKQVLLLLNYVSVNKNFKKPELSWCYEPVFTGFNKLLCERNIDKTDVELVIDKEGKTFEAAKLSGNYCECKEGESHECIGIRISDILSHFFGELSVAIECELRESEIMSEEDLRKIDYFTKKLLSAEWFDISEEQFLLWRKIEMIFANYQLYEWTGYDSVFGDYPVLVFALLEYIYQYQTYKDFTNVTKELHSEYFNTYCCNKLANKFIRGGSKPAI